MKKVGFHSCSEPSRGTPTAVAYLPLPCSLSYCELNSGRFREVLACKLLKRMAPQVGLEPTTLRLTAGQCASCSLILKAFLAVKRRHNRCT